MDNTLSHGLGEDELQRLVDTVCSSFETAIRTDPSAQIEDYLAEVPVAARPALLIRLASLEIRYRVNCGESPSLGEYIERFPQAEGALRANLEMLFDSAASMQTTLALGNDSELGGRSQFALGDTVGRYQLVAELGRGGFGEVWRASDPLLSREVAVKIRRPRPAIAPPDEFLREGQRLAQLDHRGIIRVLDAGEASGIQYIVSELMEGGTLAERLRNGVSAADAVRWTIDIANALHHAHSRGFVHRDIKPSNILFDDNSRPRIGDFGVAASEEELLEEPPRTIGTVAYMSPEQARGDSHLVDPRSDVYSLGVVLYQMLTSRLPFSGRSPAEYLNQICEREPRPPRVFNSEISTSLEQACLTCLSRAIPDRFNTARELAECLSRLTNRPRVKQLWIASAVAVVSACLLTAIAMLHEVTKEASSAVREASDWHAALEVVAWEPYDIEDAYGYDEVKERYQFDAFGHAVFSAGTVDQNDVELEMNYSVTRREGLAGVVWGIRREDDGTDRCWAVMAGRYQNTEFRVQVCEFTISTKSGGRRGVSVNHVHWWRPVKRRGRDRSTLRIQTSEKSVSQIWIDDQEVLDRPLDLPQDRWDIRNHNVVGFCGHLGTVCVYDFNAH